MRHHSGYERKREIVSLGKRESKELHGARSARREFLILQISPSLSLSLSLSLLNERLS